MCNDLGPEGGAIIANGLQVGYYTGGGGVSQNLSSVTNMALGSGGAGGAAAPPAKKKLSDIFNVYQFIMPRVRNCHTADSHKRRFFLFF